MTKRSLEDGEDNAMDEQEAKTMHYFKVSFVLVLRAFMTCGVCASLQILLRRGPFVCYEKAKSLIVLPLRGPVGSATTDNAQSRAPSQ